MQIEDDSKGWVDVLQNGTSQRGGFAEGKATVEARVLLLGGYVPEVCGFFLGDGAGCEMGLLRD